MMELFSNLAECFGNALIELEFLFAFAIINGSQIPGKCHKCGAEALKQYCHFKKFFSVILFDLVDGKSLFICVT